MVRRRVQQDTLGRRGHRDDPLYRIRRLLTTAKENFTDRGRARLEAALQAGDPSLEVTVAWHAHQDPRSMFRAATPAEGRAIADRVLDSFHRLAPATWATTAFASCSRRSGSGPSNASAR